MQLFLLIISLLASLGLSASEYKWQLKEDGKIRFAIAYEIDGSWQLDQFVAKDGDFQERTSSKRFSSLEDIEEKLKSFSKTDKITYEVYEDMDPARNKRLWKATETWSMKWEVKYAEWLRDNLTTDFFVEYGIETDCADVIIGLRWIFSRIHKLPAANTMAGSDKIFSNEDMLRSWKKLPTHETWHKDKLFMTALNYLMNNTYTHSVWKDSYPIKISSESLLEGTFFLNLEDVSGHVRIVAKTNFASLTEIPLIMRASTVPRGLRRLSEEVFLNFERPLVDSSGFRAMRWAVKDGRDFELKPGKTHISYGLQQYDDDFVGEGESFALGVFKAVRPDFSKEILINAGLKDVLETLEFRKSVVLEGYEACRVVDCSPGTAGYDAYSTPSRDSKIRKLFNSLDLLVESLIPVFPKMKERWLEALRKEKFTVLGTTINMDQARYLFKEGQVSFDPRDPLNARWTITTEGMAELMHTRLSDLFKSREQRISQRGICEKNCFPKGNWFWDANTFELDQKIAHHNYLIRNFCQRFPSEDCQNDLDIDLNAKTIKANNLEMSLLVWNDRIPFFNSDPRASINFNWGEALASSFHLPGFKHIELTDNSVAVLDNREAYNLISQSRLNLPKNDFLTFNKSGKGLIQINEKLYPVDSKGTLGEPAILKLTPKFTKAYWSGAFGALVSKDNSLIVFVERRGDSLFINLEKEAPVKILGEKVFFLEGEENFYYVLSPEGLKEFKLGAKRLWSQVFRGIDTTNAIISGTNSDNENVELIFNLQSSTVSSVLTEGREFITPIEDGLWIYKDNTEVLKVADILGQNTIYESEGYYVSHQSNYLTLFEDDELKAFKFDGTLKQLILPSGSVLSGRAGKTMGIEKSGMIHLMDETGVVLGPLSSGVFIDSIGRWSSYENDGSHGSFQGTGGFLLNPNKGVQVPAMTFQRSVHHKDDGTGKYLKLDRLRSLKRGVLIQTYPGSYTWLDR
ncbi:MAG: hypothetical protein ACJAT2_000786 [Bacteriovoracaceae bacterium]|jgi:hypothetical protein